MKLWTQTLECFNECGSKIELTSPDKGAIDTQSAAEALGWATIEVTKKETATVCYFCVNRTITQAKQLGRTR